MTDIVVVEVSIPADAFEVGRLLQDHTDISIDLTQFVPTGEAFIPYIWVEVDDPDTFEESVRNDERIEQITALDSSDGRTLYKIEWQGVPNGSFAAAAAHDLLIESATGTDERWWFRLRGYNRENLAAFQRRLLDEDIPLHVHRIWNPTAETDDKYSLTDVQRETLELAYTRGYFETPREESLAELGEELGVSHQSVSRRLRNALINLLETTVMTDGPSKDDS